MKVYLKSTTKLFLILCIFCISNIFSQDFKTISDGIEFAEISRGTEKEPIRMNLLRLDLTKVRLDVVHALDQAIGLEKTSSMASRYGAIAAINAGFFRLDKSLFAGDPTGVLMIDNSVFSDSYAGRVALLIKNRANRTDVSIERTNINYSIRIGKTDFEVGINRERKEDDLVMYKPEFNRTTLTNEEGIEFIVRNDRVSKILDGIGSTIIPRDGYILSASGKKRDELLKLLKVRTKINVTIVNSSPTENIPSPSFGQSEDIIGGVPQLIKDGKIDITWEAEKTNKAFVETKHPRTAVAKLNDGKFLMITIDGRQPDHSVGINLNDLAEFLLELGAVDAMNLDGGGSTTMFLDGKIVNKPSDKEGERYVSDAILVFPRKK